jgi:S1-C subfamily serine protease
MADDFEALDAYSAAVVGVAESVLPSVASLRVLTLRGQDTGSASVLTADGFLLTSAHVVQGADKAEAAFTDGTQIGADVIGRDPLSDLAVLRARGTGGQFRARGRGQHSRGRHRPRISRAHQ